MEFKLSELAANIGGTIEGDPNASVSFFAKIEEGTPGALCFLANMQYEQHIYSTKATAVIVSNDFKPSMPVSAHLIRVSDPYSTFAKLLQLAESINKENHEGLSSLAFVDPSAQIMDHCYVGEFSVVSQNVKIGEKTTIYAHVFIGKNVTIGENCIIYPGVKILKNCKIGNRCIIHPGTIIGSDGFGFAPDENGHFSKIPQTGIVIIEDDVEIGANCTIDRATMGATIIGEGSKLDNLIQVAHNVVIGKHNVFAAQAGVSGSVKMGDHNMIGGQVGFAGHITIGNHVKIAAQSGIASNQPDNVSLLGSPAIDAKTAKRIFVLNKNLDKIVKRIDDIEKKLNQQQ